MAFSIEELGKIDHIVGDWCIQRVPPAIKGKLDHDFEIEGQAVTLLEVRPLWRGKQGEVTRRPYAKFRYIKTSGLWQIYWRWASGKWHTYEPDPVARDLEGVLKIIEADRYGCFFGWRFEARPKEKIAPSCIRTFAAVGLPNLQTLPGSHHRPVTGRSPTTNPSPKSKNPGHC